MVPKMALLVMSILLSCCALPMEAGMVPVSWLLYSVSTCSREAGLIWLGMGPVRLLLPARKHAHRDQHQNRQIATRRYAAALLLLDKIGPKVR